MRVVLIYRKRHEGAHSIEELFRTIASELGKQVEVVEYEMGARSSLLRDVLQLRKLNADIYHVTGDVNYLVPFLPMKKTVLTVHDIGHYLFGLVGAKRWLYKWLWLVIPMRLAGVVTTISMETRQNIVNHLSIADDRIELIENCHSAIFKYVAKPFSANCPVILQVGTQPYKNVPRLVEALKGVQCRLVLIGRLDDATRQKLIEYEVVYENYVGITHEEIYRQYVACDIVTFVSIGEGFGVPIIEAQASGRPLITADVSPMREVAGQGACLVDPLDVSQIREGICKIINDAVYREQLMERGLLNVVRYSPAAISGQYLDLYKRLIHS